MGEGYTVAGVNTSVTGGGGVYLQKGKTLVYCYVTEKPGSESVDTQYCKPVK
jgi:lipoate-protein ligase A